MTTSTLADPSVDPRAHAVVSTAGRPRHRRGAFATSILLARRCLLRIKHNPQQLFDAIAFPIMFTLMFTYIFGGALAGSTREYIQTFLPGVLVFSVVMLTMHTGITVTSDLAKGVANRLQSMPIWRPGILVGTLLGDLLRYTISALIVLGLGLALGFRPHGGFLAVVASIVLLLIFAFAISWPFITLGLLLQSPEAVTGASPSVLFPFVFASNLFVDPTTMPEWLHAVVNVNPFTHAVLAVRGLIQGTVQISEIAWVLGSSAVLLVVFAPLALVLYRRPS